MNKYLKRLKKFFDENEDLVWTSKMYNIKHAEIESFYWNFSWETFKELDEVIEYHNILGQLVLKFRQEIVGR